MVQPRTTRHAVPVLMALDVSGSMYNVASDVRGGFNQYVTALANDRTATYKVSVYLFNTTVERFQEGIEPTDVVRLDEHNYVPAGGTALFDAIGDIITHYDAEEGERPLVVVHTDGEENSSREWRRGPLAAIIDAKKKDGWGFVFLGAGIDEWQGQALGMSAVNTIHTGTGTQNLYRGLTVGTAAYAAGASAQSVTETAGQWSRRAAQENHDGE